MGSARGEGGQKVRDASLDRARVVGGWSVDAFVESPPFSPLEILTEMVLDSRSPGLVSGVVIGRRTWIGASNSASAPTVRVDNATFRCWSCSPV